MLLSALTATATTTMSLSLPSTMTTTTTTTMAATWMFRLPPPPPMPARWQSSTSTSSATSSSESLISSTLATAAPASAASTLRRATAVRRDIPLSLRKMNAMAHLIRNLNYNEAMAQLRFSPKRVASTLRTLLDQARYNAEHQRGADPDRLLLTRVVVGRGKIYKQLMIMGRGKQGVRRRRHVHVSLELTEIPPQSDDDARRDGRELRLGVFGRRADVGERATHRRSRRQLANDKYRRLAPLVDVDALREQARDEWRRELKQSVWQQEIERVAAQRAQRSHEHERN